MKIQPCGYSLESFQCTEYPQYRVWRRNNGFNSLPRNPDFKKPSGRYRGFLQKKLGKEENAGKMFSALHETNFYF